MVGKFGSMGGLSTLILVLASCWTGKESKNEFITCFHESWVYEFLISIKAAMELERLKVQYGPTLTKGGHKERHKELLEKLIFLLPWQNFELMIHETLLAKKINFSSSSMAPSI